MKVKIKAEALQWNDNLAEMKRFCECKITYETCDIDDFWLLVVRDTITNEDVVVPIGDYVVKFLDNLTVVDRRDFEENFEI